MMLLATMVLACMPVRLADGASLFLCSDIETGLPAIKLNDHVGLRYGSGPLELVEPPADLFLVAHEKTAFVKAEDGRLFRLKLTDDGVEVHLASDFHPQRRIKTFMGSWRDWNIYREDRLGSFALRRGEEVVRFAKLHRKVRHEYVINEIFALQDYLILVDNVTRHFHCFDGEKITVVPFPVERQLSKLELSLGVSQSSPLFTWVHQPADKPWFFASDSRGLLVKVDLTGVLQKWQLRQGTVIGYLDHQLVVYDPWAEEETTWYIPVKEG